jgi:hypothetical protein
MAASVILHSERTVIPVERSQLLRRPGFTNGVGREGGKMYAKPKNETRPTDLDLEMAIFAAP